MVFPTIEGVYPQNPHLNPIILSPSRTCNAHHRGSQCPSDDVTHELPGSAIGPRSAHVVTARIQGILGNTVLDKWKLNTQEQYKPSRVAAKF